MEKVTINFNQIGYKAKSKHELYRMLVVEGGLYLPPEKETSMLYISQIAIGDKKAFVSKKIIVCRVPHITGLKSKDFVEFLIENCNGSDYLPDSYIDYIPNRDWLANICNTLDSNGFQKLINAKLKARESELLASQSLTMNVDKNIANIFSSSSMVSVQKGRSHHLLKKALSKKKKDAKTENDLKTKELLDLIPNLQDEIAYLRKELDLKEDELQRRTEDSEILKSLHKQGFIDQDGNPIQE